MKHCVIVGCGIIGMCTAYHLSKAGHQVTILYQSDGQTGASFVNAGYLTPSHIMPFAAPGMVSLGLKYMLSSSSPFYVKPRLNADLFRWAWNFYKSSNSAHVKKAMPIIEKLNTASSVLYHELHSNRNLNFHLEKKGLLMAYQTQKAKDHEQEVVLAAQAMGLRVTSLNPEEVLKLQPEADMDILGAFHYHCDSHSTPHEFMVAMKSYLLKQGVVIHNHSQVLNINTTGSVITSVETEIEQFRPDDFVVASGVWTKTLLKKIGIGLSLEAGKGYRINVNEPTGISVPAILMEAKVAVTPMKDFTRFAGTMELSGINTMIRKERVEAIARAAKRYYPSVEIPTNSKREAVSGMRPLSPDGLPYIGRMDQYSNLVVATGHGMMGWSLGPITGLLCQQIIDGVNPDIDLAPLSPQRRF